MIAAYFRRETAQLAAASLADVRTAADWSTRRDEARRQLREMLGLDPPPPRTDLQATITGQVDGGKFTVEKLHFQSRPGLYVTANLYVPKGLTRPAPAVLYACGHGNVKENGVSYGSKVFYQHHGCWFARNGFVCLVLDTLQLGEIEGLHHGTYREKMWWWPSRGYTPAGVEAWNCLRAIDYLQTRPEVDRERIGVTGRSGGGAYSWWTAALDERIKAAVPVAGITDLENHVVDGCVEGHCDCMFMVNTYRWDFAQVAALVAPRPLLISNTDKDNIFPLEGVQRLHQKVRQVYRLLDAGDHLGLHITEGPHNDTQELQVHAFVWLNRFLKGENPPIADTTSKQFAPEQLRVFKELPADQINTRIHETFVAAAPPPQVAENAAAWGRQREEWREVLRAKVFRGWPENPCPLDTKEAFSQQKNGVILTGVDYTSQPEVRLRGFVLRSAAEAPRQVRAVILSEAEWRELLGVLRPSFAEALREEVEVPAAAEGALTKLGEELKAASEARVFLLPRGVGPTAWDPSERKQIQHRRRFMLLGQTWEGMQIWDVRRALQALRADPALANVRPILAERPASLGESLALYAALFELDIERVEIACPPGAAPRQPSLLNLLRFFDTPRIVAMAAERTPLRIDGVADPAELRYASESADKLGWGVGRLRINPGPGR